jgi:TonB-dependent receptor
MNGLRLSPALARSASAFAIATCLMVPGIAHAQANGANATDAQPATAAPGVSQADAQVGDEIVVTGIRASLERSIAIKRDSTGVVDAISSEDIGKFPDTNLAESLQRITGVSIDRRNGEGSTVTVRGFGADYNLVTLNGRQLAATNIVAVGGDQGGDGAGGFGRSFDFSNVASEGVKTLEVYKTGRAAIPTGGIGATINVVTRKPLDARDSGFNGSIGVKADYDTSSKDCIKCGSHVTPEASGLLSWSNSEQTFGVSVYGSYQKRNFSVPSVANNGWNIVPVADFLNPGTYITAQTKLNNTPSSGYVAVPDDFRYHFSEDSRTRLNAQGVIQFKPSDSWEFEVDGLYVRNTESERRSDQSNWFNRPFDVVTFDDTPGSIIHTTSYLHEVENPATKDTGSEQAYRAQKNELWDIGGNAKWHATDNFTVAVDGHIGKSSSLPNNPNGQTSTTVAFSSPILAQWGLDQSDNGFPVATIQTNDSIKGNNNGHWDVGDLASQVIRQFRSTQTQTIKEARLDAGWDFGGGSRIDFGGDYRTTNTRQTQYNTQMTLGDWGNTIPRDINAIAPGQVQQFCLVCQFHSHDPKATGDGLIAWRTEDPTKLYNTLAAFYSQAANGGKTSAPTTNVDNRVRENIWAVYGQFTWKGQFGDHDASLVAGARYERTNVHSLSYQALPTAILWTQDNDFTVQVSNTQEKITARGKYNQLLPSMDFQMNIRDNLIGRMSFSRTLSRPGYGNLFASTSVNGPGRPTALGPQPGGNQNNADLAPLLSDNFDLSLEWYFKPGSYLSGGFFEKRVHNFIGNSIVNKSLFGLRDPSSGAPGTRSGIAKTALQNGGYDLSDVNLFTMTALLINHNGDINAATNEFAAHYDSVKRALDGDFVTDTQKGIDIAGDASDPLFNFALNTPINNKDAKIWGFELAGEYFFGHTGFGVAASYTLVRGNIGADINADPTANQFALVGLSDTYNITAIYDKNGISARLAYNYRQHYLSNLNVGGGHNPVFTTPYGQLDLNVSYDITPHLSVSIEGINLTKEGTRQYGRDKLETFFLQEGSSRYLLGARYKF